MPYSLRSYSHTFLIFTFIDGIKSAFYSKNRWKASKRNGSYEQYRQTAYHLRRKGYLKIQTNPSGEKFLKLTKKGEIELLMTKTWLDKSRPWDGKWRMIIFDIPEGANEKRDKLRRLLRANDFIKLQASVYVSPYVLNRDAIVYLKKTGLIEYIRIGRLEELDDDADLARHFKLIKK